MQTFKDVEIKSISRLSNSVNGNPRYRMHTDQGDFELAHDTSLIYGIANLTNHNNADTFVIGNPGKKVNLIGRGRHEIIRIEKVD